MSEEQITKAIENADSNVSIEEMENESKDLQLIHKALEESRNNRSFLFELLKLIEREKDETKEHGKK